MRHFTLGLSTALLSLLLLPIPLFAQAPEAYRLQEFADMVQETEQVFQVEPAEKLVPPPKEPEKTVEAYRQAIIVAPPDQKTIYQVGIALELIKQGKYEEAKKELVKFLSDSSSWYTSTKTTKGQVLYYLGYTSYMLSQLDEAEKFLKLQIELLGVREPTTMNLFGLIFSRQGKINEAISFFQEAIRRASPTQKPLYQFNLGSLYLQQRDYQRAYDTLRLSFRDKAYWKARTPRERVLLAYSVAVAAYELGKKDESRPLFEALEGNPYLTDEFRGRVAFYLGKAPPPPREKVAKPFNLLFRTTALFDTNVSFLPGQGPDVPPGDTDSMAYTFLLIPQYQTILIKDLYLNLTDYVYYIYHQESDAQDTDLLNNSFVPTLYHPFEAWNLKQRLDLEGRVDLPFFNTNGLQLFYQKYSVTPSWHLFWTDRLATKAYGTVDFIEFPAPPTTPANNLDGQDYAIGAEQTFLLFDPKWRVRAGYEFTYANRVGSNFVARYNEIRNDILSPQFGPLQFYYRGKVIFGNYFEFLPLPRRKDLTLDFIWNAYWSLTPKFGFYGSVQWMHNYSKAQPLFEYDKEVYEAGFTFLF